MGSIIHEFYLGVFDFEIEAERLHWKGDPVLNGLFEIYKIWKEIESNS